MIQLGHVTAILSQFPGIDLIRIQDNRDKITTCVRYIGRGEVNDAKFFLNHLVEVEIPKSFPKDLPIAYEIGEKQIRDYHHINPDVKGSFCLGTEIDIRNHLGTQSDLKNYFTLIAEYITLFLYYKTYGNVPIKERSHGNKGILESYQDYLNVKETKQIIDLLSFTPANNKSRNVKCPCGSSKKFKFCHLPKILRLNKTSFRKRQVIKDVKILKQLANKEGL